MASIEKEEKNKEKAQAKVDRERAKLAQIENERNEIDERLNSAKALDELKERENDLKSQNEEDQAIIQELGLAFEVIRRADKCSAVKRHVINC